MATIGAVIQARLSSSRLPGKMTKKLLGAPLILRAVEQISYSKNIDKLIVATSEEKSDDALAALCLDNDIDVYRGSLQDVQKRFIDVADTFSLDAIIRITGDNPLTDPAMIDDLINLYMENSSLDYINNIHADGAVHGAGCELVSVSALKRSYAMLQSEPDPSAFTEHVTFFIRKHTEDFNAKKFYPDESLSRKDISYSVDFPEDFKLVEIIYKNLYSKDSPFKTGDILTFLDENPELLDMNSHLHDQLPDY
jgi:spore coat polysaccharide biosynthesis protein SpsF